MTRALAALLVTYASTVGAAPPSDPPLRSVAVLEHRAGVEEIKDLGNRLADLMSKRSGLRVVDPLAAHQRLPKIDAEVAHCSGDAACLSKLGSTLQVDEILIVGISKLGDLVLALQRIDVRSQKAVGQLSEALPVQERATEQQLFDWLKQLYPADAFKRYGHIAISSNVDGATVSINTEEHGVTPLSGKVRVLAPQTYQVELSKADYVPFTARIQVPPDATVEVRANLTSADGSPAWYKRWYLWAIVGGVATAAAVGITAYTQQPDTSRVVGYIER